MALLEENFTGSGDLDLRVPDTASWYPGGTWRRTQVADVHDGLVSISTNARISYPKYNDYEVPNANFAPGTTEGFVYEFRARITSTGSFGRALWSRLACVENLQVELTFDDHQLSVGVSGSADWFQVSDSLPIGLAVGEWYSIKVSVSATAAIFEVVGVATINLPFPGARDVSLKWFNIYVQETGDVNYVAIDGGPPPPEAAAFWTGFANTFEAV